MSAAIDNFIAEPDIEQFKSFKKTELLTLAPLLALDHVKSSMRKPEIQRIIAEYYYDEGVFQEEDLELFPEVNSTPNRSERELEFEMRKLELEKEEREKQRQRELELKRLEFEKEERERQYELEKLRIGTTPIQSNQGFVASREIRLVPPFDQSEVDKYFQHFEKVAESLKWPKQYWPLMLQSVIRGKAQQAYSALSVESASDYDIVKEAILNAYELVPEAYRQKFRNLRKSENQTYSEFAHEKEVCFDRWCTSRNIAENFEKLKELVLVEEFTKCVREDIKSYLSEKDAVTLQQASKLADEYSLTHKTKFIQTKTPSPRNNDPKPNTPTPQVMQIKDRAQRSSGLSCNYCKKPGHVISDCYKLRQRRDRENKSPAPQALVQTFEQSVESVPSPNTSRDPLRKEFLPFVSEGFVSLSEDSPSMPIRVLRDTGASQSLLLQDSLEFGDKVSTDFVLVQGVGSKTLSVPLHKVYLNSRFITGYVQVGVVPSLPVKGVSLLLGNDLAGGQVVPSATLTSKPVTIKDTTIDTELFSSCAVTRAMAKRSDDDDIEANTFQCDSKLASHHDSVDASNSDVPRCTPPVIDQESSDKSSQGDEPLNMSLSREKLISEQTNDPELACLRDGALPDDEIIKVPVGYYLKEGVLMRKWRPSDIPASEDWAVIHQVVVPKSYRREILSLAHSLPLGGHLGINKTFHKLTRQFYWPGVRKDVSTFCRTCHTCQVVGKSSKTHVAPLRPIPAFGEPFSRVIIDCVGPLPKTRSGNQYMLTIMCASTRFPEAVPLRNIKAPTIAKALIKFFTLFGLPQEIQSDQGSNFTSGLMQQVIHEIDAKQIVSSAYHPQSQGALERFHSTLKTMLRTFCHDNEKDWDEGVHLVLFAARESVQESLGFSPFELIFGHQVRGPLALLREQWANKDTHVSLLDYVARFKERLNNACALAKENLHSAQTKMKKWYDKKARARQFKPGDQVLVLFPVQTNPLQAKFHGPYEIRAKVNDLNYVVITPDRRKPTQLCHLNMLKPYYHPQSEVIATVNTMSTAVDDRHSTSETQTGEKAEKADIVLSKLSNSHILQSLDDKLAHLEPYQQIQLKELIHKYQDLFLDIPIIKATESYPAPSNRKSKRFLGMTGHYHKLCKNFAYVTLPLTNLLKRNQKRKHKSKLAKEYNLCIRHIKDNVIADCLSRI